MDCGCFYYIDQQYFIDFPDKFLMGNKETISGQPHNRPCYYAFEDKATGLYWLIPISSQVEKFKTIYLRKTEGGRKCDTIVFGDVLGKEKAFLIQNMCPVSPKYILNKYLDRGRPVKIDGRLHNEIVKKANKVLNLQRKGKKLIFPDVLAIEQKLLQRA